MGCVTYGSLFAGIGGFDLGFDRAGMDCRWQVEIDPYCQKVLSKHWPAVPKFGDIRECGVHNLEKVDVICGGFPCQDISYAGPGEGLAGERSGLWYSFARIVRELEPRVVVVENVAALLDRGMDQVLGTLADIGFDSEWDRISTKAFGGPHSRERVFIVGYSNSIRWPQSDVEEIIPAKILQEEIEHMADWARTGELSRTLCGRTRLLPRSDVLGMDDGIPTELDAARIRGCGNAVVPQLAEWIGRRIIEFLAAHPPR